MKFGLKKPCADCPFRKDSLKGWLGEERAQDIADAVTENDQTFACHKTVHHHDEEVEEEEVDEAEWNEEQANRQHCAGAIAMVEAEGKPNAMLQIAERLGLRDPGRITAEGRRLSFISAKEFVAHHSGRRGKART